MSANGKFPHPPCFLQFVRQHNSIALRLHRSSLSLLIPPPFGYLWEMGSGLSTTSRLTSDKCFRTDSNRNHFKLEPVILSRHEVDGILEDDSHKSGTYILYEDLEKEKMYLAFKTSDKKIAHYAIVKMNDLYYFNDFPFPYLESIVLYYRKYKFKDTKLTNQAFLDPYLRAQRTKRKSTRSLTSSVDNINNEIAGHDKTWTYGHYKSLSTRL